MEVWKNIKGWENSYQVSDYGRIRSLDRSVLTSRGVNLKLRGKVLSQNIQTAGYKYVGLYKNDKAHMKLVHRLIAEAFINRLPEHTQVNHKDFNKLNNDISNLEWVTAKENCRHYMEALSKSNLLRDYNR